MSSRQSLSEQLAEAAERIVEDRGEENPTHLYVGDTTVRQADLQRLLKLVNRAVIKLESKR